MHFQKNGVHINLHLCDTVLVFILDYNEILSLFFFFFFNDSPVELIDKETRKKTERKSKKSCRAPVRLSSYITGVGGALRKAFQPEITLFLAQPLEMLC